MPLLHEFVRSTELAAPIAEVFAFHANPANIRAISPAGQTAEVIRGGEPARAGAEFEFVVTMFGLLRLRWLGRWAIVEPPTLLCDTASPGFLSRWEHRHEFRDGGGGRTLMTDRLTYAVPGGWLGWLAGATFLRVGLGLMFLERHRQTRAYFARRPPAASAT